MRAAYKVPEACGTGLVLYSDGGCRPSVNGYCGYGIHGYHYAKHMSRIGHGCEDTPTARGYKSSEEGPVQDSDKVTVLEYVESWGTLPKGSTNNEAELLGAICAARYALKQTDIEEVCFILDSRYVLEGIIKHSEIWKRTQWRRADGKALANLEYWQMLVSIVDELSEKCTVNWEWTKGHSNNLGNDRADYLATSAIITAKKGLSHDHDQWDSISPKVYWKPKVNRHAFLNENFWYFNPFSLDTHNGKVIYHLGNHGKANNLIGKPISDNTQAVVMLNQTNPVMELMRVYHRKLFATTPSLLAVCRLAELFRPTIYQDITRFGDTFLDYNPMRYSIQTASEVPIVDTINPPMRSAHFMDSFTSLTLMLQDYVDKKLGDRVRLTDITDTLFDSSKATKKNKRECTLNLEPAIRPTVDVYGLQKGDSFPITLTLGIDIPNRRVFSKLNEAEHVKVYVLTYADSECSFRYMTIIEMDDEVGIWKAPYSNMQLVP